MPKELQMGITLSGGGARGIAHIGVLQALDDHNISPSVICGTSAGAVVGALYAYGYRPSEILELAEKSNIYKLFRLVIPRRSLSSQSYLTDQLRELMPENDFDSLNRKFLVGVTNLNFGKHEVWDRGPLQQLVVASSAIPGIFEPVEINNCLYVDGGVMNNMPADPLRSHCEYIIASNVVTKVEKSMNDLNGLKSILARVFEISLWYRSRLNYDACDMIIEHPGLHNYHLFSFSKAREIYEIGYQSAVQEIEKFKGYYAEDLIQAR